MARIRSVHPDLCEDATLVHVSDSAERTFVRLWTYLDDDGRVEDRPKLLAARLYPEHDNKTAETVDADLSELASFGLIIRYTTDGKHYLSAKPEAWHKYQSPRHPAPSKFPPPPGDYVRPTADSGNPTADRRSPTDSVPKVGVGVGGGEGEGEGVGEGVKPLAANAAKNPLRPLREGKPPPQKNPPKTPKPAETITVRRSDPLFEAVANACGLDWQNGLTKSARGALNRAVKDLRGVGAHPNEVRLRAGNWPYDATLTPSALAKHWPQLANPPPRAGPKDRNVEMMRQVSEANERSADAVRARDDHRDVSRGLPP